MQYSTYRRPCSTSNLSLNGLSFLPAASLVWSQGSQMPLKQKHRVQTTWKENARKFSLNRSHCWAQSTCVHTALLSAELYQEVFCLLVPSARLTSYTCTLLFCFTSACNSESLQDFTKGFWQRHGTGMEREKEVSKERQDKSSRNSFLPVQIDTLPRSSSKIHQLPHACNKKI